MQTSESRRPLCRTRRVTPLIAAEVATPLGPMIAAASDAGLVMLEFADQPRLSRQIDRLRARASVHLAPGTSAIIARAGAQLAEYFRGARRAFDLPLDMPGTEFQRAAWRALRDIPYGDTRSYAEQARAIGRPDAVRAVARANGDNRIAIVVPCHRVIGTGGDLTGYGGQLWRKRALLEIEGALGPSIGDPRAPR